MIAMPRAKKKVEAEPTLHDVVDKLVQMDTKLTDMDTYMRGTDTYVRTGFALMNERMDGIDGRLGNVERKLSKVEVTVLDIQDELRISFNATDKDSEKIINHERRIRRLEKAAAT